MRPVQRAALLAAAGLVAAVPLAAQQTDTVPAPRVHQVQRGETLWDLARIYLNDPFLWPEIFRLNTDVVEDPALIYPRDRLVLPGAALPAQQAASGDGRTIFYRGNDGPKQRPDRMTVLPAGSANFPVVRVGDFYRAGWVAPAAEVSPVGRVAELISPTVVPLSREPAIQVYDRVYVQLRPGAQMAIGDRVQFVRQGREMRPHGFHFASTGIGTVADVEEGVATVVVVRMYGQVAVDDMVVPVERFPVPTGVMPARSSGLQARILGFEVPNALQAVEQLAFLDVGRAAGVREGDEFEVYLPREARDWGTRPEIAVGRMQVVKVTQSTATARIVNLSQPAVAVGLPVRRVAAMPAPRAR